MAAETDPQKRHQQMRALLGLKGALEEVVDSGADKRLAETCIGRHSLKDVRNALDHLIRFGL
jgi:hypothetical protein